MSNLKQISTQSRTIFCLIKTCLNFSENYVTSFPHWWVDFSTLCFCYKDQSTAYDLVMLEKDYRYCQWTFQNCICLVFLNTHIEEIFSLLITIWSGMTHMTLSANRHSKNVHAINCILMDIDSSISLTPIISPISHYLVKYFVRVLNIFSPQLSRTSRC